MPRDTTRDRVYVRGQWLDFRNEKTALGYVGYYDVEGIQVRTEPCKLRREVPGRMAGLLKGMLRQREKLISDRKKLEALNSGQPKLREL